MSSIQEVINRLEAFAPPSLQESYDNSGLLVGDKNRTVSALLISLDCTEAVVQEAIEKKCNLIVCHHPIVFSGLKKLTGSNYVERCIMLAIKNDVAIYAMHTNLDSAKDGVNWKIAEKLNLNNVRVLSPVKGNLKKLVSFVPSEHIEKVRTSIFDAGAGNIGKYDHCSFNAQGIGTFRAGKGSNPFVGEVGKEHHEAETKLEVIFEDHLEKNILNALFEAHPYEEVAYEVYLLENKNEEIGIGIHGELKTEMDLNAFLKMLAKTFGSEGIRFAGNSSRKIKKVSVCGGSGSFLIPDAIASKADVFVTSDIKYHQFFDAEDKIILVDIGHYESEQFTVEIIDDILKENFSTFASYFSSVKTNPINYF